jgi:iron complex transport system permease protein
MNNRKTKSEFIDDMVAADGGIRGYHRAIRRKWAVLGILVIITVFMCLLSVNAGAATMTPIEVLKTLLGISGDERSFVVIWRLRMPRVVAAIVAGAGLSIAGCVMQTTLKNPLASPSTLGVSAGATFGANLAIILLGAGTVMNTASDAVAINNPYLVTFCAFACAFGAVILIMALSNLRGFTPESIVLSGTALSSLFAAGTTIIQYFGNDVKIAAALFWTFGDLGRVSWSEVTILAVITFGVLIYFMFMRWNYNAMANGEETAKSLGVNTSRIRFWSMLSASLLTAVSVSFMGMIGCIGLIGPQIMKRIVGSDHRFLVPGSALLGSVILLAADTCARTVISPIILPVGAITSLLGAPMFFYMLLKGKRAK